MTAMLLYLSSPLLAIYFVPVDSQVTLETQWDADDKLYKHAYKC